MELVRVLRSFLAPQLPYLSSAESGKQARASSAEDHYHRFAR